MKWHPSSIGKIMTNARSKSEVLSETAKSYIKSIAKQDFYGYNIELNNKYIIKGIEQEQDSIDLVNAVRFTDYKKNKVRLETELMTGECDILLDDTIIDIKSCILCSINTLYNTNGSILFGINCFNTLNTSVLCIIN